MRLNALVFSASLIVSSTGQAEDLGQSYDSNLGANDTSLVILENESALDSEPGETYSGSYRNEPKNINLRISRTGRVSSNIAILGGNTEFPVSFQSRLIETADGFATSGFFTAMFFTSVGIVSCDFPANLLLNFFEEGEPIEAAIEFPNTFGLSSWGQCVYGRLRVESFELERQVEP